jgi:hypothetical protein
VEGTARKGKAKRGAVTASALHHIYYLVYISSTVHIYNLVPLHHARLTRDTCNFSLVLCKVLEAYQQSNALDIGDYHTHGRYNAPQQTIWHTESVSKATKTNIRPAQSVPTSGFWA